MRIKANVVTQAGRILRPVGAVFEIDDETAKTMIADGRAVAATESAPARGVGAGPKTPPPAPTGGKTPPPAPTGGKKESKKRGESPEPAAAGSGQTPAAGTDEIGELNAEDAE